MQTELGKGIRDVMLDRLARQEQPGRDLDIRGTESDQFGDFALAAGKSARASACSGSRTPPPGALPEGSQALVGEPPDGRRACGLGTFRGSPIGSGRGGAIAGREEATHVQLGPQGVESEPQLIGFFS